MTEYDPKTGKLRPTWTIRFSPWTVFVGSLIGGAVTGGIIAINILMSDSVPEGMTSRNVGQAAVQVLGLALLVFLLLGPVLGWGLGFTLRNTENQGLHVLAFAGLGLFVGYSVGEFLGRLAGEPGLGMVVAPAFGIGAAVGRWMISRYARL